MKSRVIEIGLISILVMIVVFAFFSLHESKNKVEEFEKEQEIDLKDKGYEKNDEIEFREKLEKKENAYKELMKQYEAEGQMSELYPEGFVFYTDEELAALNESVPEEDRIYMEDEVYDPDINYRVETDIKVGESYAALLYRMASMYNKKIGFYPNYGEWTGIFSLYDEDMFNGNYGIGNVEYVQALYQHTFGVVPDLLKDFSQIEQKLECIDSSEVYSGDIAVAIYDDTSVEYAVCVGNDDNGRIYAICNNVATDAYPYGCAKLVYNGNETEKTYDGNMPILFTKFYRSPVTYWGVPAIEE